MAYDEENEDRNDNRDMSMGDIESFKDFKNWAKNKYNKHKGKIRAGLFGIALLWLGPKSCYIVPKGHQGVEQRFGAYSQKTEPGLRFKIPLVDDVTKADVKKIQKEEFGYRVLKSDVRSDVLSTDNIATAKEDALENIIKEQVEWGYFVPEGENLHSKVEKLLQAEYLRLAGDLNISDIEFTIQYHICRPEKYLFNLMHGKKTLRDIGEAELSLITGDRSIDEILTIGRAEIESETKTRLQNVLDFYETGLCIDQINLQSVNPPRAVQDAFNDVNRAKQEKESAINTAWAEYNKTIPETEGEAKKIIKQAQADSTNRVNYALGDVQRFSQIYSEYRNAPEITRTRMYLEMWDKILPNLKDPSIIEQKGAEGGILQTLPLDKK